MTKEEENAMPYIWFRMALKSCGINLDVNTSVIAFQVAKIIAEKGDKFSLGDAAKVVVEAKDIKI